MRVSGKHDRGSHRRSDGEVTLDAVAKRAGVHPSTASRVLNQDISHRSDPVATRIRSVAEELGYRPNRFARGLRTRRTFAVGVLVPRLTDIVLAMIFEAVRGKAERLGYQVLVASTQDRPAIQSRAVRLLIADRVDGLIIASSRTVDPLLDELAREDIPFVLMNRRTGTYPSVTGDDELGGYVATKHLIDLGHHRIGLVAGPKFASTALLRGKGYRRALAEAGLPFDRRLIVPSDFSLEGGRVAGIRLLETEPSPTAIFAVNDFTAIGVMSAAGSKGHTIPRDLAVVGYNDIPLAAALPVPLTSVRSPLGEIGRIAMEMLAQRIERHSVQSVILRPDLQIRESSLGSQRVH